MKKPGTITLYNENGVRLSFYRYSNSGGRKDIIKYWQKFYRDNYGKYYYQIAPDIEEEQTQTLKRA